VIFSVGFVQPGDFSFRRLKITRAVKTATASTTAITAPAMIPATSAADNLRALSGMSGEPAETGTTSGASALLTSAGTAEAGTPIGDSALLTSGSIEPRLLGDAAGEKRSCTLESGGQGEGMGLSYPMNPIAQAQVLPTCANDLSQLSVVTLFITIHHQQKLLTRAML
jgi:hypothetical protein